MTRTVISMLALGVTLIALTLGVLRVYALERAELEHQTSPRSLQQLRTDEAATRLSARLAEVRLRAGERAVFELCAQDGLPASSWQDALELAVLHVEAKRMLLRVPLDAAHLAHVRRNAHGGCLLLGSGLLEHTGTYTIEAVWPLRPPPDAVTRVPLYARVLGKPELRPSDRYAVAGFGLLVLVLLGAAALAATKAARVPVGSRPTAWRSPTLRVACAAAALLLLAAATQLPLYGATLTLVKGVGLLALQCGAAFWLASALSRSRDVRHELGLGAPTRPLLAWGLAALAWPLLVQSARLSLRLVPSTGEAPIETFVSWPSGMLSAALLGVFLPVGEELFFRGYLYGVLLARGRTLAFALSLCAFVLLHAQQSWGNWGGLLAVFGAGFVLTGLRALTGSTLLPALTHVSYNLTLSLASLPSLSSSAGP